MLFKIVVCRWAFPAALVFDGAGASPPTASWAALTACRAGGGVADGQKASCSLGDFLFLRGGELHRSNGEISTLLGF